MAELSGHGGLRRRSMRVRCRRDEEDDPIATPFCNSNSVVAHGIAESRVLL